MTDAFIQLPPGDRADILQTAAAELGYTAQILEKDLWVCWALEALFSMPDAYPMAFKGGTSLSKLWSAIDRFSEDVDITIDYHAFGVEFDHHDDRVSRSQQKRISEELRERVKTYVAGTLQPYIDQLLVDALGEQPFCLDVADDGETLILEYPKAPVDGYAYITDAIKLEFGGRNTLDPSDHYTVAPYLESASSVQGVSYPVAHRVRALSVERTFWEKVTLVHAACGREQGTAKADRMSRHWYDLAMLVNKSVISVDGLLQDPALLTEVIRLKQVFYYAGYAKYEDCLNGGARLIPKGDFLDRLRADYDAMRKDYIGGDAPGFDGVIATVGSIETTMNVRFGATGV